MEVIQGCQVQEGAIQDLVSSVMELETEVVGGKATVALLLEAVLSLTD